MEPLIVLVVVTLALRLAGAAGIGGLRSWHAVLRGGLSAMFVVTGVSHFVGMRAEMIEMVPPFLPAPGLLITLTGLLELAGAVALLWPRLAPWAAGGLTVMLVGMFPANVYAALEGITTHPMDALLPRTLVQIVFVAATVAIATPAARLRLAARRDDLARRDDMRRTASVRAGGR